MSLTILEEFEELVATQNEVSKAAKRFKDLLDIAILRRDLFEDKVRKHFASSWEESFPGVDHSIDSTTFRMRFSSEDWNKTLFLKTVGDSIRYEVNIGWFYYDSDLNKVGCEPPVDMEDLREFLRRMEEETGVKFILGN